MPWHNSAIFLVPVKIFKKLILKQKAKIFNIRPEVTVNSRYANICFMRFFEDS